MTAAERKLLIANTTAISLILDRLYWTDIMSKYGDEILEPLRDVMDSMSHESSAQHKDSK